MFLKYLKNVYFSQIEPRTDEIESVIKYTNVFKFFKVLQIIGNLINH